jgi:hypothetical protein
VRRCAVGGRERLLQLGAQRLILALERVVDRGERRELALVLARAFFVGCVLFATGVRGEALQRAQRRYRVCARDACANKERMPLPADSTQHQQYKLTCPCSCYFHPPFQKKRSTAPPSLL